MAFAQLTCRTSLRHIETCLRAQFEKPCHMGASAAGSPATRLPMPFRPATGKSTPMTRFPAFIHISDGKLHDVNALDMLLPEAGAFHVMDRACPDFKRLHQLHPCGGFFVPRAKSNAKLRRLHSRPADRSTGLVCDQVARPDGVNSATDFPAKLRRIRHRDSERGKTLIFLANNFTLPAMSVADIHRSRRQVELLSGPRNGSRSSRPSAPKTSIASCSNATPSLSWSRPPA